MGNFMGCAPPSPPQVGQYGWTYNPQTMTYEAVPSWYHQALQGGQQLMQQQAMNQQAQYSAYSSGTQFSVQSACYATMTSAAALQVYQPAEPAKKMTVQPAGKIDIEVKVPDTITPRERIEDAFKRLSGGSYGR